MAAGSGLTSNTRAPDANQGAPVHIFDPEAPPEEKAASIRGTTEQIKSTNGTVNKGKHLLGLLTGDGHEN
jgi:hypothetical protein